MNSNEPSRRNARRSAAEESRIRLSPEQGLAPRKLSFSEEVDTTQGVAKFILSSEKFLRDYVDIASANIRARGDVRRSDLDDIRWIHNDFYEELKNKINSADEGPDLVFINSKKQNVKIRESHRLAIFDRGMAEIHVEFLRSLNGMHFWNEDISYDCDKDVYETLCDSEEYYLIHFFCQNLCEFRIKVDRLIEEVGINRANAEVTNQLNILKIDMKSLIKAEANSRISKFSSVYWHKFIAFRVAEALNNVDIVVFEQLKKYEKYVENKKTFDIDPFELLEKFAKTHNGEGLADFARTLFSNYGVTINSDFMKSVENDSSSKDIEQTSDDIELQVAARHSPWSIKNRLKYEDGGREPAPDFIRRVYKNWLGKGLTRTKLRELDRPLMQALERHAKENSMPDDLVRDLPTASERSKQDAAKWVAGVNADGSEASFTKREVRRFQKAAQRHDLKR